jgi:hypothetical protein
VETISLGNQEITLTVQPKVMVYRVDQSGSPRSTPGSTEADDRINSHYQPNLADLPENQEISFQQNCSR